ncbi:MAG: hypothetical protein E5Y88_30630 [Mesorhizobium sp.]|nr:hypothetical protein EJ075_15360 [Mesorhizobium sp. M6A.T.Cr.TU.016.01.1.1]RWP47941.1 MAG: hypothetical protein EOR06_27715 [Mesorhizobium sp.]RWP69713.1 MAG: hypothetical protein EOR09_28730 [Mesorhizobium sp.]RWQ81509.1 MAG: hypothetical protein EOS85_14475 [Mesorhizobium sp.]TIL21891.1 MAG: hypothetical protein E5Y88_30630 [Mesorhizobium sp.]
MAGGPHRPIGKHDRVFRNAGQDELAAVKLGTLRIYDGEGWDGACRLDLADGLFQRHVRLLGGFLRHCARSREGKASSKKYYTRYAIGVHTEKSSLEMRASRVADYSASRMGK